MAIANRKGGITQPVEHDKQEPVEGQGEANGYAFSLRDVSVRRSGNIIVRSINWESNLGDNWVLLGANGIGKSTLVNILSSRMFPTTGEVTLLGRKLGTFDVFELRDQIGVLGADIGSAFPGSETVRNIVALGASGMTGTWGDARDLKHLSGGIIARADEMLELFGVHKITDRQWRVLSQGERKRVMMARVLMPDPKILLFDEPTAGLDLAGREQVINVLNRLAAQNRVQRDKVILLVNHNVEEIPPSFDSVAIMGRDGSQNKAVQSTLNKDAKAANGGGFSLSSAGTVAAKVCARCDKNSAKKMGDNNQEPGTILFQGSIKQTLTSKNLTKAYGIDLQVTRAPNLRYFASASVIIEGETIENVHNEQQSKEQ